MVSENLEVQVVIIAFNWVNEHCKWNISVAFVLQGKLHVFGVFSQAGKMNVVWGSSRLLGICEAE